MVPFFCRCGGQAAKLCGPRTQLSRRRRRSAPGMVEHTHVAGQVCSVSMNVPCQRSVMLQAGADGDTVLVYPSKIDPHCEALVFVLSASDSDVSTMNLTTSDALHFNGQSAGEKKSSLLITTSVHHQICNTSTKCITVCTTCLHIHATTTGTYSYGVAAEHLCQRSLHQQMPIGHILHSCCNPTLC